MSDLLEFRLLKYISVIAETGNITRAAEKLYTSSHRSVTRSSISKKGSGWRSSSAVETG
jgi:Bacterial regulatory helix-turn-helix protein, lysR family